MITPPTAARLPSLRAVVLAASGQDVRQCWHCAFCGDIVEPEQDLSVESLLQLVLMNDEEVLTSNTLWSEQVLQSAESMCANSLDIGAVIRALRVEARRRGLADDRPPI